MNACEFLELDAKNVHIQFADQRIKTLYILIWPDTKGLSIAAQ